MERRYRAVGSLLGEARSELNGFLSLLLLFTVLAIPLGWLNAGRTQEWPLLLALSYWLGANLMTLIIYEAVTRAIAPALKLGAGARLGSAGFLICLLGGATLSTPILEYCKQLYVGGFQATFVDEELRRALPDNEPYTMFLRQSAGVILWLVLNLILARRPDVSRFGYNAAPSYPRLSPAHGLAGADERAADVPRITPTFLARVSKPIGTLLALASEEHYLRVIGDCGEDLILYRISDAERELEGIVPGQRVHRSYWVAETAVQNTERTPNGFSLLLVNGMKIPVSRKYRGAARCGGLL